MGAGLPGLASRLSQFVGGVALARYAVPPYRIGAPARPPVPLRISRRPLPGLTKPNNLSSLMYHSAQMRNVPAVPALLLRAVFLPIARPARPPRQPVTPELTTAALLAALAACYSGPPAFRRFRRPSAAAGKQAPPGSSRRPMLLCEPAISDCSNFEQLSWQELGKQWQIPNSNWSTQPP
jgi:hypothetical protein